MANDILSTYAVNNTPVNAGVGGKATNRGWFSVFNRAGTAKEDWMRAQQAADNDFYRTLALQDDSQAFNADEAQKTRDWEKMMSDTSYQRAVADLRTAGLNPILAYSQGGASTPQGAFATSSSGSVQSRAPYTEPRVNNSGVTAKIFGHMLKYAGGLVSTASQYERSSTPIGFSEASKSNDTIKLGKLLLTALKTFAK